MSTDYGFKCRECDEKCVPDNMRDTTMLQTVLASLDWVRKVKAIPGLHVTHVGGYVQDFDEAVDFALKHTDRGHTVVVCDEYNRELDQCPHYAQCGTCGHQYARCVLKYKHEGDHSPKASP